MKQTKFLMMILFIGIVLFLLPTISHAAVDVSKEVYANNGSAKFNFTGLTLDKTHEYEFGLTKTAATEIENWHLITEYTETTATVDITAGTKEFTDVIVAVDTGYITIKDKTTDTIVLQPYAVDLSIPYLNITNYTVISNGKDLDKNYIQINFWNRKNSSAYYQYEKITDENVINKYKEIKSKNGDFNSLQSLLKTKAPSSNWNTWGYWNGHGDSTTSGFGYTQKSINTPDEGLYYMWIYLAGDNIRNLYGYILVDNLQPEIALDSISLPKTKEVELGKTLTLTPTFSPENTTNKIITWSSSDESVATIDNGGKIEPKKIGSTIITATSQDGNKKATCTVTVISSSKNQDNTEDTTQYLSFPFIIINGKSSISVKNYKGNYQLYYQFVEVNDEQYSKLTELKENYKNSKITYAEFLSKYKQILPQYNEANWIQTADGKFEKDLSGFTGTKKFALWGKLVMDTKTVYEAQVYTMDGSGKVTNTPNEVDNVEDKNTTVKDDKVKDKDNSTNTTIKDDKKLPQEFPQTGAKYSIIIIVAALAVICISVFLYKKYILYKDIK